MKKIILMAAVAVSVLATSCKKDDDGGDNVAENCKECSIVGIPTKYCDKGNGKVDITTTILGESNTTEIDLPEGTSFEKYTESLCKVGTINIGG